MQITREQFESYEQVRQSGVTNMFNLRLVCEITDLTKSECIFIMENYEDLKEQQTNNEVKEDGNTDNKVGE